MVRYEQTYDEHLYALRFLRSLSHPPRKLIHMAAIVQAPTHRGPLTGPLARPSSRPSLRVIEGGRSPRVQRVYRRRRGVALALGVVAVALVTFGALRLASAVAGAWSPATGTTPASTTGGSAAHVVVVQPGDTLWSIATRLHPSGDIRAVVDRLARAHGPGPLQPGERIALAG